jgi:uncharacterized protein (TIGR02099 family)
MPAAQDRPATPVWRRLVRAVLSLLVGLWLLVAGVVALLQYWVLPHISDYRDQVAAMISRAVGEAVTMGGIEADWSGLHPHVAIGELRFLDATGQVVFELPRVSATLSWTSLLAGELRLHGLVLESPALRAGRGPDGRFYVAGLEMDEASMPGTGMQDWLLRQGDVLINSGRLQWRDQQRGAAPLELSEVQFRLHNRLGHRHEFAISARPPGELASAIDLRGRFVGETLSDPAHWNGELYARFERIDLAGWAAWVDYPVAIRSGAGSLTAWVTLLDSRPVSVTADVSLDHLRLQMAPDSPWLDLAHLGGRLTGRQTRGSAPLLGLFSQSRAGFAFEASGLEIRPAGGIATSGMDLALAWHAGRDGVGEGSAQANRLDLAVLAPLAGALTLPRAARAAIEAASPAGIISDLRANWSGPVDAPVHYRLAGRYEGLAVRALPDWPGFDHLAGRFDLTEAQGQASARGQTVHVTLPTGASEWEHLAIDLAWDGSLVSGDGPAQVRLVRSEAGNRDIGVTASGLWRASRGRTRAELDLTVDVQRVDLRQFHRYLPPIDPDLDQWLRSAFLAGQASGARIHWRGRPDSPTLGPPGNALLEVSARVEQASLRLAPGWPTVDELSGMITIHDRELRVVSSSARMLGVPVRESTVRIADLAQPDAVLQASGWAEADSAEFLRYVGESPLRSGIGSRLAGVLAEGRARLDLQLSVPLEHPDDTQVNGSLQLTGNRLQFAADQPRLTDLAARIEFNDRGVSARGNGRFLGSPVNVVMAPRADQGVAIAVQGVADIRALAQTWPFPLSGRLRGSLPYRANLLAGSGSTELVLESDLQGLSIDLPAPLGKAAGEALPFRLRRSTTPAGRGAGAVDALEVSLGGRAHLVARMASTPAGPGERPGDRVGIVLGEGKAVVPDSPGIVAEVNLAAINLDPWRGLLDELPGESTGGTGAGLPVSVNLKAGTLTAFGRQLHGAAVRVRRRDSGWAIGVAADEALGELTWRSRGAGRLEGRFTRLRVPDADLTGSDVTRAADPASAIDALPAMQLSAEHFMVGGRDVGRLVLEAINEAAGWRISRLDVAAPEGTLHASGLWRHVQGGSEVELGFDLGLVDGGAWLGRVGQPGALSGAAGTVQGKLQWRGVPHAVDYPSLRGSIELKAGKGQFLRAEPGVGRLLGVLSLQSLPRRITLDFRDVFSDGFAFDQIEASGTITQGVLTLGDFRMGGPSAAVQLSGSLDLAQETQNLRARIIPELREGIAAAAGLALVNPLVGLGTLIAQRLFNDPVGRLFSYDYDITGSWRDPRVTRHATEAPPASPPPAGTAEGAPR